MNNASAIEQGELLWLSHELGREDRDLAILGEGNTSARLDEESFWVKASGSNLATLGEESITRCRFDAILPLLEQTLTDVETDDALLAARVDATAKKPSVETLFHAYLLTLPDVKFIGHTHPIAVNQILCSPRAKEYAQECLFPDQAVCCGGAMALVPYTDPGLALSRAIRDEVEAFIAHYGEAPRVILLENHGLIALGRSPQAVLAATLMAEKTARIFIGAAAAGGPTFLGEQQVGRILGRPDEHYRRRELNL